MARRPLPRPVSTDPLWYKDAIVYESHVRAFSDSDADGIGDFAGLTARLDYLQDLGITALWLLPFYPSPLRDDGYDIADYCAVHPAYGTLGDFRRLLREARRRHLRVITEMVLNHTSDQHPWFQRARRAPPGSPARDFYVWSDTPERYREARVIFKDFEPSNWTYDHEARAYYWHRFYAHQPDLNWENPRVRKAMLRVIDFWFGELGVDGLRLDAVPYLFEREGTSCENLPETHAALKEIRRHVEERYADKMLLAEANQWPEDAVAYFGQGDECHTAFHFPLMPRLFMGIQTEDRYPIVDVLEQTPEIPESCQWVLFLRNHDELTLEMVTDEERDYMYRVYARDEQARINLGIRRRLAPLLGNSRRKIELMNGLLFSLPGTPVIYYGDEIGMGDNFHLSDRNGVRTPMQWSPDRNAGFSRANSQQLYFPVIIDPEYHYQAVNVDVQQNNPQSLLWWMKRILGLRKQHRAFGRGRLQLVHADNGKVLAFTRTFESERLLVVANLSRFAQHAELSLPADFRGAVPVELFGRTAFPRVGEGPYPLALGPHAFYWFSLESGPHDAVASRREEAALPEVAWGGSLEDLLADENRHALERVLPDILRTRTWFNPRRAVQWTEVRDVVPLGDGGFVVLVAVEYTDGEPETYLLTLMLLRDKAAETRLAHARGSVLARLSEPANPGLSPAGRGHGGVLADGLWDRQFAQRLLALAGRRSARGAAGPSAVLDRAAHTSMVFGTRFVMRVLRRIEDGPHPDVEIGRYLTEARSPHVPPLLGALEYARGRTRSAVVGTLHGYVAHETDAWTYTIDELGRYVERVLTTARGLAPPPLQSVTELAGRETPPGMHTLFGVYLDSAALMGQRTADFHRALFAAPGPDFTPEPFSEMYQRSLMQSLRNLARRVVEQLRQRLREVPEDARADAQRLMGMEAEIVRQVRAILARRHGGARMRYHGNLHLGQLLHTGRDFVIIMSEGEAGRSLADRRLRRSPLRDVAALLRSLHYAVEHASRPEGGAVRREDLALLEPWLRQWRSWASASVLRRYDQACQGAPFHPRSPEELRPALWLYMMERALIEIAAELERRPDWAGIPVRGALELMEAPAIA